MTGGIKHHISPLTCVLQYNVFSKGLVILQRKACNHSCLFITLNYFFFLFFLYSVGEVHSVLRRTKLGGVHREQIPGDGDTLAKVKLESVTPSSGKKPHAHQLTAAQISPNPVYYLLPPLPFFSSLYLSLLHLSYFPWLFSCSLHMHELTHTVCLLV